MLVHKIPLCFLFFLTLILTCDAFASAYKTKIGLNVEHTNNSGLLPKNQVHHDIKIEPSIGIDYTIASVNFHSNLNYSATRIDYEKNTFADRSDVLGSGTFLWKIFDRNLVWNFYQNRSRLKVDSLLGDDPSNQTNRNIIHTGPRLSLDFGRNNTFSVDASYVDSSFSQGITNNSQQGRLGLEYQRTLNAQDKLKVTAHAAEAKFDNSIFDYQSKRYGLTLERNPRSFQYLITIGHNSIDRNMGGSFSGVYLSFSVSANKGNSSWSFSGNKELTDSSIGTGVSENLPGSQLNSDSNLSNADIVERIRSDFIYRTWFANERVSFAFNLYYDDQVYQTRMQDRKVYGLVTNFTYRSTRKLTFKYTFRGTEDKTFVTNMFANERSTQVNHRLQGTYRFNPHFRWTLWLENQERNYQNLLRDYDEIAGGLTLEYQF